MCIHAHTHACVHVHMPAMRRTQDSTPRACCRMRHIRAAAHLTYLLTQTPDTYNMCAAPYFIDVLPHTAMHHACRDSSCRLPHTHLIPPPSNPDTHAHRNTHSKCAAKKRSDLFVEYLLQMLQCVMCYVDPFIAYSMLTVEAHRVHRLLADLF